MELDARSVSPSDPVCGDLSRAFGPVVYSAKIVLWNPSPIRHLLLEGSTVQRAIPHRHGGKRVPRTCWWHWAGDHHCGNVLADLGGPYLFALMNKTPLHRRYAQIYRCTPPPLMCPVSNESFRHMHTRGGKRKA